MQKKQIELVIGSLLHDIGKVVRRAGDNRNHSLVGTDFLKETRDDFDKAILECVKYHHEKNIRTAALEKNSLAYITCFADNVAAAIDRRDGIDIEDGFDEECPLESVFNILNGNSGKCHYEKRMLNQDRYINFPTVEDITMDESFYSKVVDRIRDNLKGVILSEEYINSILSVLEAGLSYIPSSTSKRQLADISLYDHVKITAAIAECCYQYMESQEITDYNSFLLPKSKKDKDILWSQPMFMLYSMDISGIQNFIYTIRSAGALKSLRARSFYLELVMEHIVDELLEKLNLSRSCLIYTGGGHCYMLLPNTPQVHEKVYTQCQMVNAWFMKYFDTALYIADGYAVCSPYNLQNEPQGSYSELFRTVSRSLSEKKLHRYTPDELLALNRRHSEGKRECQVCRRTANLNANDQCPICSALEKLSSSILYKDYFITVSEPAGKECLPLPGNLYLIAGDGTRLVDFMKQDSYVRSYTVNEQYTGKDVSTKIWVSRYNTGETFAELAHKAAGIERLAVLRADVDNLGHAFVNGFKDTGDGLYETISRTATLSRQLSLFFKLHLNTILANGKSNIFSPGRNRQICIVYSGGDDMFFVGAWNEVIDSFIDVREVFEKFTQGTLTISGGIGLYDAKFPVNIMASQTAELEDLSKSVDGKNAITLFDEDGRYSWDTFINEVLKEKYQTIYDFMKHTTDKGKVFLYQMLEILRGQEGRFNRARYVYFLSRIESEICDDSKEEYKEFTSKMYRWTLDPEGRRQIVTAIYLYVYMTREKGESADADK